MEALAEILVPISLFAATFLSLYFFLKGRNKERLAMIEQGIYKTDRDNTVNQLITWGLLLIGIGIGILLGNLLHMKTELQEESAYFAMILLFGGLGLLLSFYIRNKLKKQED